MGLHARVHRVRVRHDLHDHRGVPACIQGHRESFAQAEGRAIQLSDLFTNSIFTDVVLSLAAMLGLYIVASLIFVSRLFTFSLCFRFIDG